MKGSSARQSKDVNQSDSSVLEILNFNRGFENPHAWIEYAKSHRFNKVEASHRQECPECGETKFRIIGQFVHYSQLPKLKKCQACRLIYSDVVINSEIIRTHFEFAYKDVTYHERGRRGVFEHIAALVEMYASNDGSLVDIGGGMGHLAGMIAKANPNRRVVFNDISQRSCAYASSEMHVEAVCSALEDLSLHKQHFDVILMIDVLYYVQDLSKAWRSIHDSLGGKAPLIILRIPNKIWWVELRQLFIRNLPGAKMADKIVGMNSEHLYIFCRSYLRNKLLEMGFSSVRFEPSPLTDSENFLKRRILKLVFALFVVLHRVSFGWLCLTPSQIVIARRGK